MKNWKEIIRIPLAVMLSLVMVASGLAPTCIAFAEDEAAGAGAAAGATEVAEQTKKEAPAPQQEQQQEQKEEPKEEPEPTQETEPVKETEPEPLQSQEQTTAPGQKQVGSEEDTGTGTGNGTDSGNNDLKDQNENKDQEDDKEPEDNMPAQSFSGSSGGISVRASAAKGVFPAGTRMKVSGVSSSYIISAADSATGEKLSIVDGAAVDITFFSKDGREIQPAEGSVSVGLSSRAIAGEVHEVVHVAGGRAEIIGGASSSFGRFNATHFSIYGIVGGVYEEDVEKCARYTYIFKVKGKEVDRQTVIDGESLRQPATPDDKSFEGWKIAGQDQVLDFSQAVSIPDTEENDREFVVNAAFSEVYYATFYRDEKKSEVLQVKEGLKGDTVTTGDVSGNSPEGKPISGWRLEGTGEETPVSEVTFVDRDLELLPIALKNPIQVTFDTGGGTPIAPVFVESGGTLKAPSEPERAGYTFKGWFVDSNGTIGYDFSDKVTSPLRLHAKWEGRNTSYKVVEWKQNANDDGYSFVGIETKSGITGTVATYTSKTYEGFTLNSTKSDHVTLIDGEGTTIKNVYYDRKTYKLTFKVYNFFGWIDAGEKEFKYQQDTSRFWAEVNEKYTNRIWRETREETKDIVGDAKPMPDKNWTLYGRKSDGAAQVIYIESGTADNKEIRPRYVFGQTNWSFSQNYKAPAIPGFTYKSRSGPAMEDDVLTGRVYYERNKYAMHFVVNGGRPVADVSGIPFEGRLSGYAPASYNVGQTTKTVNGITMIFAGWYSDESLQNAFDFSGKMPALEATINTNRPDGDKSTLVLYAKWEKAEHSLSFNLDGGAYDGSNQISAQSVESGKQAASLDDTKMEKDGGYVFSHWATEDGARFSFDTSITRDYVLKAVWNSTKAKMIRIAYDAGEGSEAPVDGMKYQAGSYAAIKGQPAAPSEMYFKGWKIGSSNNIVAGGLFQVDETFAANDVITLRAQYQEQPSYPAAVIYNANEGTFNGEGTYTDNNATVNGDFTITDEEPIMDEATFLGWSRNANATAPSFKAGQIVASGNGDNILYAVWKFDEIIDPITDDPIEEEVKPEEEDPDQGDDDGTKSEGSEKKVEDPVNSKGNNGGGENRSAVKGVYEDPVRMKAEASNTNTGDADPKHGDSSPVRTGDDHMPILFMMLMLAALVVAVRISAKVNRNI